MELLPVAEVFTLVSDDVVISASIRSIREFHFFLICEMVMHQSQLVTFHIPYNMALAIFHEKKTPIIAQKQKTQEKKSFNRFPMKA